MIKEIGHVKRVRHRFAEPVADHAPLCQSVNKLKHGPQLVVSNIVMPEVKDDPSLKDTRFVRLLFQGTNVAINAVGEQPAHVYLEDSGEAIQHMVDDIEIVARDLFLLASYVYYFKFGTWAHSEPLFHPLTRVTPNCHRLSEQWYENSNGWVESVIKSPPKYPKPP